MPGERLVERELAEELGVSRTPIRECFAVLENEGLVEASPGMGATVRRIDFRDVIDSLQVRATLDGLAAELAAKQRTDEDLVRLEANTQLVELAIQSEDISRITSNDRDFHDRIYSAAHNPSLVHARNGFALYQSFYFHPDYYRYTPDAFQRSQCRHQEIVQAIRDRATESAGNLARWHILETIELVHDLDENDSEAPMHDEEMDALA